MDEHSLRVLEFDKILTFLQSFATSPGGKQQCARLVPLHDPSLIADQLAEVTEMKQVVERNGVIPIRGVHDIAGAVERARIPNMYLEVQELRQIQETINVARNVRSFFAEFAQTCPRLHTITKQLILLPELENRLQQSFSPQGDILDTASRELARIRMRMKSIRSRILHILEHMVADVLLKHVFQEDLITIRNNRYVVLVRTDSQSAVPGVVHDQSQSKATFFIEPFSVVNLNNELQITRQEEAFEIITILTQLTQLVNIHQREILLDLDILERLDVIYAKALFSKALKACAPVLDVTGVVDLRQCRHPMLLAQFVSNMTPAESPFPQTTTEKAACGHWEFNRPGVVPIDLIKPAETTTLVITGANAGGKTVALKTLGLLTVMAQAGMHIPVSDGSTLCVYKSIYADIGDEQNIETNLSTFSAHIRRIDQIVRQVRGSAMVLLDEIGSGTDPAEGAALALGILDFLREQGCFTVITTHLALLKTYAYRHSDVQNVSVAFDPQTLKPCYQLIYGLPGLSNAFAMAQQLGLSEKILQRARLYQDRTDSEVRELMTGLERSRQELYARQQEFRAMKNQMTDYEKTACAFLDQIRTRKDHILKEFEREARQVLREGEKELLKIIAAGKRQTDIRPDQMKEAFQKVKKKLLAHVPKSLSPRETISELSVGESVSVVSLQKTGIVASVQAKEQRAEIIIGTMKVGAAFSDLQRINHDLPPQTIPRGRPRVHVQQHASTPVGKVTVVGLRVDEALPIVDRALDQALVQGVDRLEIVHGVGTGRLKKAIQNYLKNHRCVSSFVSGDMTAGGAGITIVAIKG